MPDMARRVADFGTTVFAEITALARDCGAINLGQGFPDFDGPHPVLQAAIDAVNDGVNQYPPGIGFAHVREAVAAHARRFYDQAVDPTNEVLVTAGATEAVFAAILGLTDPGDEVIVFAPTYDSYVPNMTMAGASPRIVYMNPPDWSIDPDELAAAFTPRTRAIIVNTPHNPTGKVYSRDELSLIAELCQQHDIIAITDEVYEHLIYDGGAHTRLATLPGMAERTLTISSLGKTFSVTGWKVGWAIGPRALVTGVNRAHQFITYAVASPLQAAAAAALALPDAYFAALRDDFQARRDYMLAVLQGAGFKTLTPQGGYFILAEWQGVAPEEAHIETDEQFARWLTCEAGVAAIPPSAFYAPAEKHRVRHLIRFAACKKDETLRAAAVKLETLRTLGK